MITDISQKTLAELKAFTAKDIELNPVLYLKDEGKEGEFIYDPTDTTTADNVGTVLVTSTGGFRFKRRYTGRVQASWFLDTTETSGTGGNRERNAVNRAVTFALAQTTIPEIVLDNKRIWYFNSAPVITSIPLGKILKISGEQNATIDFYFPESFGAVFRNAVDATWTYAEDTYTHGTFILEGVNFTGSRNPVSAYLSANYGCRAMLFRNMERVEIRNCSFSNNYGSGFAIGVTKSGIIEGNTFKSVYARQPNSTDATGDGITIYAFCKDMQITNNYIELLTGQYGRCGISVDDRCSRIKIEANSIIGYERGIHVEHSLDCIISNNNVSRSPSGGLSGQNKSCLWENNIFDGFNLVYGGELAATGLFTVYLDDGCTYNNNIVKRFRGDGSKNIYLAKFWGNNLTVSNNRFGEERTPYNSVTSTTSNTIGTGSKTFTYASNPDLVWWTGQSIRAYDTTSHYYMEGTITAVSATSVTINFTTTYGSATSTTWLLSIAYQGDVWGDGFNDYNNYVGNTFIRTRLYVGATESNIVRENTFKGSGVVANGSLGQETKNIQIIDNQFIPYPGEIHSKNVGVYYSIRAYVANNLFKNPLENVIENSFSVGGIFTNNIFIRSYASAAGNDYFYVNSALATTNVTRTMLPNVIYDYINTETWHVWNTGVAVPASFAGLASKRVQSLTSAATITANANTDDIVVVTALAVAAQVANVAGTLGQGQEIVYRIKDNGSTQNLTYGSNIRAIGVTLPTATTAGKTIYLIGRGNTTDGKLDIIDVKVQA